MGNPFVSEWPTRRSLARTTIESDSESTNTSIGQKTCQNVNPLVSFAPGSRGSGCRSPAGRTRKLGPGAKVSLGGSCEGRPRVEGAALKAPR